MSGGPVLSRDELSDRLHRISVLHGPHPGPDCGQCGVVWPCPTVALVRSDADLEPLGGPGRGSWAHQRRSLVALGWSIAFAGGALFGLLMAALGLPGVWWAPVILAMQGGFWLYLRPRRAR